MTGISNGVTAGSGSNPGLGPRVPPGSWSRRTTWVVRSVGLAAFVGVAATVWLGLWVTPPGKTMGNLVRLVYVHPAVAWIALYVAFGTVGIASALWLWPRTRSSFFDRLAASAMEVGTVFTGLTLVTGSIWGRTTWGVWWAWDARLTSTALLFVLQLGYLALRRIPSEPDTRARRSAVAALVSALDVPIVHFSVLWWRTLHQQATVLTPTLSVKIYGSMAWTMLLGFVAFTLLFFWMLAIRMRSAAIEDYLDEAGLDSVLEERWAEGGVLGVGGRAVHEASVEDMGTGARVGDLPVVRGGDAPDGREVPGKVPVEAGRGVEP